MPCSHANTRVTAIYLLLDHFVLDKEGVQCSRSTRGNAPRTTLSKIIPYPSLRRQKIGVPAIVLGDPPGLGPDRVTKSRPKLLIREFHRRWPCMIHLVPEDGATRDGKMMLRVPREPK